MSQHLYLLPLRLQLFAALRHLRHLGCLCLLITATPAMAQGNVEINTPAIAAIKAAMQGRFAQMESHFATGAIGLTNDGAVDVRDAQAIPLAQRQAVSALVAAENRDRSALYREIAQANGRPEWEREIRSTFAQRWIDKAPAGWWVRGASGWVRK